MIQTRPLKVEIVASLTLDRRPLSFCIQTWLDVKRIPALNVTGANSSPPMLADADAYGVLGAIT